MPGFDPTRGAGQAQRRQQTPAAPAAGAGAGGNGFQPTSATSVRSAPRLAAGAHIAQAPGGGGPVAPAPGRQAKRIQMVQRYTMSTHPQGAGDARAMLTDRIDSTFAQFHALMDQGVVDRRPGTTQVFTLPEFFWNDFGQLLSEGDTQMAMNLLSTAASDPKFENTLFLLGTMMTAVPPAAMQRIPAEMIGEIATTLGLPEADLAQIHAEALSSKEESTVKSPPKERVLLTAVGSLAEKKEAAGAAPQDAIRQAATDVRKMAQFDKAMALMSGFAKLSTLTDENLARITNPGDAGPRAALEALCPGAPDSAMRDFRELQNLIADTGNRAALRDLLAGYRDHMAPFKMAAIPVNERGGIPPHLRRRDRAIDYLARSSKFNNADTHEKGRAMYKAIDHAAILMEGGTGAAPHRIQKFSPSPVDVPSFRPDGFPHAFRQPPSNVHPEHSEARIKKGLEDNPAYDVGQQRYDSAKHQFSLGMVICRDVNSQHFTDSVAQEVRNVDLFQVISAGVDTVDFERRSPMGPIGAHNDGSYPFIGVHSGHRQAPVSTTLYKQDAPGQAFEQTGKPEKTEGSNPYGTPFDPSSLYNVSSTIHLDGRPASDAGSFVGPAGAHEQEQLARQIETCHKTLSDIESSLAAIQRQSAKASTTDPTLLMNETDGEIKLTPEDKADWQATGESARILDSIRGRYEGERNATQAILTAATARLEEARTAAAAE